MTAKKQAMAALVSVLSHVDHLTIDFKNVVEKEIAHLQAEIDLAPKPVVADEAGNDTSAVADAGADVNTTTQTEAEQSAPSASTASTTADASNTTE